MEPSRQIGEKLKRPLVVALHNERCDAYQQIKSKGHNSSRRNNYHWWYPVSVFSSVRWIQHCFLAYLDFTLLCSTIQEHFKTLALARFSIRAVRGVFVIKNPSRVHDLTCSDRLSGYRTALNDVRSWNAFPNSRNMSWSISAWNANAFQTRWRRTMARTVPDGPYLVHTLIETSWVAAPPARSSYWSFGINFPRFLQEP